MHYFHEWARQARCSVRCFHGASLVAGLLTRRRACIARGCRQLQSADHNVLRMKQSTKRCIQKDTERPLCITTRKVSLCNCKRSVYPTNTRQQEFRLARTPLHPSLPTKAFCFAPQICSIFIFAKGGFTSVNVFPAVARPFTEDSRPFNLEMHLASVEFTGGK